MPGYSFVWGILCERSFLLVLLDFVSFFLFMCGDTGETLTHYETSNGLMRKKNKGKRMFEPQEQRKQYQSLKNNLNIFILFPFLT